jgi:transcription factor SPT20
LIDLLDHRGVSGEDSVTKERVVLQPNGETLWADICLEHERNNTINSDEEAMEIEARMLVS